MLSIGKNKVCFHNSKSSTMGERLMFINCFTSSASFCCCRVGDNSCRKTTIKLIEASQSVSALIKRLLFLGHTGTVDIVFESATNLLFSPHIRFTQFPLLALLRNSRNAMNLMRAAVRCSAQVERNGKRKKFYEHKSYAKIRRCQVKKFEILPLR